MAVLDNTCQLLRPQGPKLLLHLAEAELNTIVLRSIGNVKDVAEAQFRQRLLALLGGVRGEVVHEDADLVLAVSRAQLLQVLLELRDVDRVLDTTLLGHACQQGERRLVQRLTVDGHILLRETVLRLRDGAASKACFIQKDDSVAVSSRSSQRLLHLRQFLLDLLQALHLGRLGPDNTPLRDAVELVDLSEQLWIQVSARVFS